ncbi:hypothetical protein DPMN_155258 [Dreissena polymorpha]|uniref:Peptidase A2 domain-containing protein n=1 Tax=Dreissena polymorpha TaxID=45954 RepID=A0A9D4FTD9_DREPO|nr:hypothetical protein DPMN_155258 [Dreissena polymorpha]
MQGNAKKNQEQKNGFNRTADEKTEAFKRERTSPCGQREVHVNDLVLEGQKETTTATEPVSSCNDRDYGDGLYIEGTVEDTPVVFTTDTGASKTIVSSRIFNRLRESEKPKLTDAIGLRGAGGMPIKVMGRGAFRMQLGPVKRLQEAIVADIEEDVLLGYDVLGNAQSPADFILSRSIISLDGKDIPCIQKRLRQMRKVTVADDVLVPGNSEAVIEVYVEREETCSTGHICEILSVLFRNQDACRINCRRKCTCNPIQNL